MPADIFRWRTAALLAMLPPPVVTRLQRTGPALRVVAQVAA